MAGGGGDQLLCPHVQAGHEHGESLSWPPPNRTNPFTGRTIPFLYLVAAIDLGYNLISEYFWS